MNRSRFIQGLKGDIQLSEKERRRIIRKSLQKYSWKTKCTVAMEEFAELQQQVSKQVRGYGDRIGLLEEMADAMIMPDAKACGHASKRNYFMVVTILPQ